MAFISKKSSMTNSLPIAATFPGQRVLIVEDLVALAIQYKTIASKLGVQVVTAGTVAQARRQVSDGPWQAALVDLNLPDGSGFTVLEDLRRAEPDCAVVVITAEDALDNAVRASEAGAFDFIEKPVEAERLLVTLRNALHAASLAQQVARLQTEVAPGFEQFIGQSVQMQAVYKMLQTIATSNAPVCITGESGTGKELAANAVHARSPRRHHSMVALNCAAIPKDLIESELFGHVRGAFTGAVTDRQGVFLEADKGTLFLDEIAELDLGVQAKLLRVLQTGEVKRLGEDRTRKVDVRIVCATHRNLADRVRMGEFREDLFYRLYVVPVELPPLRARDGDVVQIARLMLKRFADEDGKLLSSFTPAAETALSAYEWPGNVRELINVVRAVVALHEGTVVELGMLPANIQNSVVGRAIHEPSSTPEAVPVAPEPVTEADGPAEGLQSSAITLVQLAGADLDNKETPWFAATDAVPMTALGPQFARPPSSAPHFSGGYSTPRRADPSPAAQNFEVADPARVRALEIVEREAIEYAIQAFRGNVTRAAKALRVNPSTIYRKMQSWDQDGVSMGAV
jgi:two-component system, repressor protein LuxO